MNSSITFRKFSQKVLFEHELQGQLSDGQWENARPFDHWKPWCDIKVLVGKDVGTEGVRSYAKRNYNFASSDLLEAVGDRMITFVRIANRIGIVKLNSLKVILPDNLEDFDYVVKEAAKKDDYYSKKLKAWKVVGINYEFMTEVSKDTSYGMKELKADLNEMKKAIKIIKENRTEAKKVADGGVQEAQIESKPKVKLLGLDGNAFFILGAVRKALKKAGTAPEVIEKFHKEATSGDYSHLLATVGEYVDVV